MQAKYKPMTSQEIYRAAKAEWISVLSQLWEAFGKSIDPKQFKVYFKQLGNIPLGVLEGAIAHLLKGHRYNSVPTIAEVYEAVKFTNPHDWEVRPDYVKVFSRPNRALAERNWHEISNHL